jgi:hypothetical protein
LEYLGASLTNKIRRSVSSGRFEIILRGLPRDGAQAFGGVETGAEGAVATMVLFSGAREATVLHEAGHMVDQLSREGAAWAGMYKPWSEIRHTRTIDGVHTGAEGDFISTYAKSGAWENYAESFEYGVMNGSGSPCPYPKENRVYICCKAVFEDLVSFAGYGSRATQRMAGYLGIDISDKLAALY